jgi:hypothetical protein
MNQVGTMTAFREMSMQLIRQLCRWHTGLEVHGFTSVRIVSCAQKEHWIFYAIFIS